MSDDITKLLTEKMIKSMREEPDVWGIGYYGHWKHPSGISYKAGYNWLGYNDNRLKLSWWSTRKLTKATKTLMAEKTLRAWDRNEL